MLIFYCYTPSTLVVHALGATQLRKLGIIMVTVWSSNHLLL